MQVTVNNLNDSPYGNDNEYVSIENQTLQVLNQGVLSDDFDSDGDPLSAQLITGPQHGELTFHQDGTFLYAPDGGFFGVDTFTYVANDGTVDSEVITVTLRVIPQLPPPTLNGPPTTETRDTPETNPSILPTVSVVPTNDSQPTLNSPTTTRERGESKLIAAVTGSGEVEYDEIEIGERGIIDWRLEPRRLNLDPGANDAVQLEHTDEEGLLWDSLDQLAESTRETGSARMLIVGSALILTALSSIAYTIWTVWCGFLTTSILSLMPGWKLLDPLPVLEEDNSLAPVH